MKIKQKQKGQRWRVHNFIILMCLDRQPVKSTVKWWYLILFISFEHESCSRVLWKYDIHQLVTHAKGLTHTWFISQSVHIQNTKHPTEYWNCGLHDILHAAMMWPDRHKIATGSWCPNNHTWLSQGEEKHKGAWRDHFQTEHRTVSEMHLPLNNYVHIKWVHVHVL